MSLDYNTLSPTHSAPFIPSTARIWITGYVKGYFRKAAEMREEIAVWHQLTLDAQCYRMNWKDISPSYSKK